MSVTSAAVLDTAPLTERVRRRDVRRFARAVLHRPNLAQRIRYVALPAIGLGAVLLGIAALLFGMTQYLGSDDPDRYSEVVAMAGILLMMVLAAALLSVFFLRSRGQRLPARAQFRLARFAERNGWSFVPGPAWSSLAGAAMQSTGTFIVRNVVATPGPPAVEVGDFELITGQDQQRQTRFGGYCAIRLPRSLPNLLLRATGLRSHPASADDPPDPRQRLSLEGAFDRSFALFCPRGYEADALYLLTPDVMARLLDAAGGWDVEIRDDVLLLTRARDAATLDPVDWRRTLAAVDALDGKVARWVRWREGRESAPIPAGGASLLRVPADRRPVAAGGRRLRPDRWRQFLAWVALPAIVLAFAIVSRFL